MTPSPASRLDSLFHWGERTYVMGILNITEDSFSGDGVLSSDLALPAAVVGRASELLAAGADLLDIGAESTRPGCTEIPVEVEAERVATAVRVLRSEGVTVPLSVDTSRSQVARAALANGADIINDISGLARDPGLLDVLVEYQAAVVLTHNCIDRRRTLLDPALGGSYRGPETTDIVREVVGELEELLERVTAAGLDPRQTIIDPGIGLGKNTEQNLRLTAALGRLRRLGRPVLYGSSRKAFIGHVLGLPVYDRLEGTAATVALGIRHGADIVRVHDVGTMARVVRMSDAITRLDTTVIGG